MTNVAFPPDLWRRSTPSADIRIGERLAAMEGNDFGASSVFRALNAKKIKAVLVGAHAVNARSGDPRNTVDVDIVAQFPKKAVRELMAAFPSLSEDDHLVVTRLFEGDRQRIDVIKPQFSAIFVEALKSSVVVRVNDVPIRIPPPEVILAMKFSSLIALSRLHEKKLVDARDFILIAKQLRVVDVPRFQSLGEVVYPGGGDELLKMVQDARAGRQLRV